MKLEFTKMEGLGNDYIYVDASRFPIDDPAGLSRRLSDRHFGVGGDGLVLIGPSEVADFSMRMFNADGSEGMMCGNAARCIGKYVYDKGLTRKLTIGLQTPSGVVKLNLHPGPDCLVDSVTVDMGVFRIVEAGRVVEACGKSFTGTVVDVGNPHFVVFCEDAGAVDPHEDGPGIEKSFPGGINVEFASVVEPGRIRMRVWERGSGVTLACGTGASATAAAAFALGLCASPCRIDMDGGTLSISRIGTSLLMTGPARTVFEGNLDL
ncbi:MAG: diaminopimelate epimerase [Bacteroidales bacterium]|nr:diaminopimelate epimerase [Bacteroidales bacterium]